jgi:hypothetical protein
MKMNFSVAARTPFMNAVYHTLFWIPLPLLGFHPADILAVEVFSFFLCFRPAYHHYSQAWIFRVVYEYTFSP